MADRIIFICENDRASYRGVKRVGPNHWKAYQRSDDDLKYTLDYSNWLGSDTISSVTRTASGPTVAGTSDTTPQAIQRLSGNGYVDIAITTSGSQVRVDRIEICSPEIDDQWPDDYR